MKRFFTLMIIGIVIFGAISANAEIYRQIRIAFPDKTLFLKLMEAGLEPISGEAGQYLDFAATDNDLQKLHNIGVSYTVIHEDMTAFYNSRNPLGTTMGGYRTYSEMTAVLDSFSTNYPNICTPKFSIGITEQGRNLWCIKVSDNPSVNENEPEAFINAVHHAREPIGMEICLEFMRYLFTNYGTDPVATNLVNNYQLYFCPISNPDGYEYNHQTNPGGGGMWRKNRRNNLDGSYGVDPNRNYTFFWGYDDIGSSPSTSDETYRGAAPASEPEISGLISFQNSHDFSVVISYHAYADDFLYPYGYYDGINADQSYYDSLAAPFAAIGYVVGTPWQLLYNTNGDASDWGYGEERLKKRSFETVVEVGTNSDGFWPPQNRIAPLVNENINALKVFLPHAYDAYKRRWPLMPTVTSPSTATPGNQFYVHWTHSVADTFNLPVSYRVIEKSGFSRDTQTFETTTGYTTTGFNRSSTRRHNGTYSIYSGQGTDQRKYVTMSEKLKVQPGDSLTFWAWYNIQSGFDYAYVQISTDNGNVWIELNGNLSTSSNPNRHNKGFGITGSSNNNWARGVYPLTYYVGQEIKVRFSYWTDASTSNEGIYIDDIYPTDNFSSSTILSENVVPESLQVGPYNVGYQYFVVEARDDRGQLSGPSSRLQVTVLGTTYSLNGHVTLLNSPSDLSGSIVTIPAFNQVDTTDISGTYHFAAVGEGTYNINASHAGYTPDTVYNFAISSDTVLNFQLSVLPPATPALLSPPYGGVQDSAYVHFDWNDVPGAERYIIEATRDISFSSIDLVDSNVTVSNYRTPQPLSNGTYFWRVTSRNQAGFSPRSGLWNFTIDVAFPAPTLIAPIDYSVTDTSLVNFDWADLSGAISYVMEVATDSLFANRIVVDSSLTVSAYSSNFAEGHYYWRVTAYNGSFYSNQSEIRDFEYRTSLEIPAPIAPVAGFLSDTNWVSFDWSDVAGAHIYIFEVSSDSDFTTHVIDDSTHTGSSFAHAGPFANGQYFWRITASNGLLYSGRSEVRPFSVNLFSGIPAPALLSPGDGYISPSGILYFDWTSVDDTITYLFQLASDPAFSNIVIADSSVAVSDYRNQTALNNGEYHWRVRATDGVHWSPYSESWTVNVSADTSIIPGDANGSGTVNGVDIIFMVNFLKGGEPPIPYLSGDVNGSCDVNGLDVIYLVNFFKGGAYPFRGNCLTNINLEHNQPMIKATGGF
jgi:hypothetical protein